jgi:hypothetical protein
MIIRVRNGKGATGAESVAVPFSTQLASCPVRRLIAYTRHLRTGPLFRHVDRHGKTHGRLNARPVGDVVRRMRHRFALDNT